MPARDPASVDFQAILEEQRKIATEEAATFARQKKERDAVLQVLELKAAEQQREKQRKNAKQLAEEEKKKRAAALLALENEIRDALERFPQRTKDNPDRYKPYPDGYNYGFQTRWSEDKDTKCTRCTKANVVCWRSVLYSAELYPCIRCKDRHRGCDRGLNATGPITRRKRAQMCADAKEVSSTTRTSVSSVEPATGASVTSQESSVSSQETEDITIRTGAGSNSTRATSEAIAALVASIDRIREMTEANTSALMNLADENRRGLAKIADLEKIILRLTSQGTVIVKEEPQEDSDYLSNLLTPVV